MHLFYTPDVHLGEVFQSGLREVGLDESESQHAARVLRLKPGDRLKLTDGKSNSAGAVMLATHPKHCTVRLEDLSSELPLPYRLHLAVAPTKNIARFEWFLEKATEIGISEITPLICHRSERQKLRLDRLQQILISAMKQSLKSTLPILHQPTAFPDFIGQAFAGNRYIAWVDEQPRPLLRDMPLKNNYTTVLIGPEGDFTPEEISLSLKHGYQPVSLGRSRLRTETAAMYAVMAVSLANEQPE